MFGVQRKASVGGKDTSLRSLRYWSGLKLITDELRTAALGFWEIKVLQTALCPLGQIEPLLGSLVIVKGVVVVQTGKASLALLAYQHSNEYCNNSSAVVFHQRRLLEGETNADILIRGKRGDYRDIFSTFDTVRMT